MRGLLLNLLSNMGYNVDTTQSYSTVTSIIHTHSHTHIVHLYCYNLDVENHQESRKPDLNQPPSAISNKSLALFLTSVHRTVETNEV